MRGSDLNFISLSFLSFFRAPCVFITYTLAAKSILYQGFSLVLAKVGPQYEAEAAAARVARAAAVVVVVLLPPSASPLRFARKEM